MSRYIGTGSKKIETSNTQSIDTSNFLLKTGSSMSGELDMGRNKITSLKTPTADADASTKKYVDDEVSEPNVINTGYTTSSHNDTITVSGSSITTRVNNALTASELIEAKKIVELSFSHHMTYLASFVLNGNGLTLFGQLDNLSGYVRSVEITVFQPTAWTASATLTSVQMMMSNETDPTTMTANLTEKLTKSLSPGTHKLTPLTTKFTGLRYIGFFWEGGDTITQIEFTTRIVLWLV